jgi:hypothetical protein
MHYSYTGVGAKICFPFRSTQKCFTPTLGVNTKNVLDRFFHPPNKCSKVLVTQSFVVEKRHGAMQNLFIKKEREREMDKCPRY